MSGGPDAAGVPEAGDNPGAEALGADDPGADDALGGDVPGDVERVRAALVAYGAAFEAYDAHAVAAHFAVPALLVRDGVPTTLDTRADVLDSVERLLDLHRAWAVETTRVAALTVVETAPAHVVARVDWRLGRRASRVRWTYTTTYVLVPDGDALRIAAAMTHDAPF